MTTLLDQDRHATVKPAARATTHARGLAASAAVNIHWEHRVALGPTGPLQGPNRGRWRE
jgi:hypothetical protein